jgi:large subunit ribosomal protein L28
VRHTMALSRAPVIRPRTSGHMSKICVICGKKPSFGNNRSHSMRATPRRWDPNVQKVRIQLDGKPVRAYVCAKCLKAHKVEKVA